MIKNIIVITLISVISFCLIAREPTYKKRYCHDCVRYVRTLDGATCITCSGTDVTQSNDGGYRCYCPKCDRYRAVAYADTPLIRIENNADTNQVLRCMVCGDTNIFLRAEHYFDTIASDTDTGDTN